MFDREEGDEYYGDGDEDEYVIGGELCWLFDSDVLFLGYFEEYTVNVSESFVVGDNAEQVGAWGEMWGKFNGLVEGRVVAYGDNFCYLEEVVVCRVFDEVLEVDESSTEAVKIDAEEKRFMRG